MCPSAIGIVMAEPKGMYSFRSVTCDHEFRTTRVRGAWTPLYLDPLVNPLLP